MAVNREKKVLFVMQLPPPVHGVSVMNELIKNSSIINESITCHFINLTTAKNIDDLQRQRFSKYLSAIVIYLKVLFKLCTNRYEYVYVTLFPFGSAFYKDSIVVLLARLFFRKPLVHLHTYGFRRSSAGGKMKMRFYKFVFRNTQPVCLSDRLLEDIADIFQGSVFILPNGIPQVNFENSYRAEGGKVPILYLSNLIRGKGILLLIEAASILKQRNISFELRIAGAEGDVTYAEINSLVKNYGLHDNVTVLGPRFGEEKYEEFRRAGIFVLPSNYDTFGLVLLEAMQFGVPCVSTNVGGIPDVLAGGAGRILPEISAAALSDALQELICHPETRQRMSQLAFKHFSRNFTINIFEQKLLNILMGNPDVINHLLRKNNL
jgi:glycosyltransferase involved in cell wall biosynthesis